MLAVKDRGEGLLRTQREQRSYGLRQSTWLVNAVKTEPSLLFCLNGEDCCYLVQEDATTL
jgi:hypothetical protein